MAPPVVRKILIAPDALLAELSTSFLDRRSFRVRSAARGDDLLAIARVWQPDAVVVASRLPDLAAREVLLRLGPLAPAAKRVLLVDEDDADDPAGAGPFEAQLTAPVEEGTLLATLSRLLGSSLRRAERLSVDLLAKLTRRQPAGEEPPSLLASVIELSETGALLECEHLVRPGEKLAITFSLPGSPALELECTVVNADNDRLRYPVRFDAPDEGARDSILVFIELATTARRQITRKPPQE